MPDPSLDTIALTLKRYASRIAVSEDIALELDVHVQREVSGQLLFNLRTQVLTHNLPPEQFTARDRVVFEVPASTWQMWKQRHARRWYARSLVARRPVRYEPDPDGRGTDAVCTFDLERWRSYPRARVPLPDRFGAPVLVHAIRDIQWDRDPTSPAEETDRG